MRERRPRIMALNDPRPIPGTTPAVPARLTPLDGHRPDFVERLRALMGRPPREAEERARLVARADTIAWDLAAGADHIRAGMTRGVIREVPGVAELIAAASERVERVPEEGHAAAIGETAAAQADLQGARDAQGPAGQRAAQAEAKVPQNPPLGTVLTSHRTHVLLLVLLLVPLEAYLSFPSLRVLQLPDAQTLLIALLIGSVMAIAAEVLGASVAFLSRGPGNRRGLWTGVLLLTLTVLAAAILSVVQLGTSREHNTKVLEQWKQTNAPTSQPATGFSGLAPAGSSGSPAPPSSSTPPAGGFGAADSDGSVRPSGFGAPAPASTAPGSPAEPTPDLRFSIALQLLGILAGAFLALRFHLAADWRRARAEAATARREARQAVATVGAAERRLARAAVDQDRIERRTITRLRAERQLALFLRERLQTEHTRAAAALGVEPLEMPHPELEDENDAIVRLLAPPRPVASQPVVVPLDIEEPASDQAVPTPESPAPYPPAPDAPAPAQPAAVPLQNRTEPTLVAEDPPAGAEDTLAGDSRPGPRDRVDGPNPAPTAVAAAASSPRDRIRATGTTPPSLLEGQPLAPGVADELGKTLGGPVTPLDPLAPSNNGHGA